MQNLKLTRRVSVILSTVLITAFGCVISFSANDWSNLPLLEKFFTRCFGGAKGSLFDLVDYIASNWILLLNGLAAAIYAGWVWGTSGAARELYRTGADLSGLTKLQKFNRTRLPIISWSVFIRFISPVLIFVTFLSTAGFFDSKKGESDTQPQNTEQSSAVREAPAEAVPSAQPQVPAETVKLDGLQPQVPAEVEKKAPAAEAEASSPSPVPPEAEISARQSTSAPDP